MVCSLLFFTHAPCACFTTNTPQLTHAQFCQLLSRTKPAAAAAVASTAAAEAAAAKKKKVPTLEELLAARDYVGANTLLEVRLRVA